ncbi:uncharacterized protein V1513DRAFT_446444 [Lipomyces chichibuensis]|uniref:uncharacterized protein n=1 Tax=Lipomyces chichibuensis TaxID=1546026 RepID=UPI003343B572
MPFRLSFAQLSRASRMARPMLPRRTPLSLRTYARSLDPKDYANEIPKDSPLFEWEDDIKYFLSTFPGATNFYTNADGSTRIPTDEELMSLVKLREYIRSGIDGVKISEYFTVPADKRDAYFADLEKLRRKLAGDLDAEEGKILDKIPVEDHEGHLEWEVIREKKKEGWEPLIYYGYLPIMGLVTLYFMFGHKNVQKHWALEELRLQTEEKYLQDQAHYKSLTPEQQLEKQLIIVDKILSGNYDELISH